MAVILNAYALSGGETLSTAVQNADNVRFQFEVSGGTPGQLVTLTLQVDDGNGYVNLLDDNGRIINYRAVTNASGESKFSRNIKGINSANVKVRVEPQAGHTGSLTINAVSVAGSDTNVSAIQDVELSVDELKTATTDGSAKTQNVDPSGNYIHPAGTPMVISAEVIRPADTTDYTAKDTIANAAANVAQVDTLTLTGAAPTKQQETLSVTGTSGTADITGVGGLTKTLTFDTDTGTTAAAFVAANEADYLAAGITLSYSGSDLIFTSLTYGTVVVTPVITTTDGDLSGTVVTSVENVVIGQAEISAAGGLTNTVVFDTATGVDLTATAALFVTDYAADYATEGITLTSSGADLIFTSDTAGVSFTSPVITNTVGDLDGTVENTTPNTTIAPLEFAAVSVTPTGGGILMDVKVETNIVTFAGQTIRVWVYNAAPTVPLGDNVAFVNDYDDKNKLLFFVDVEMEALNTGSDSVVGVASVAKQYNVTASNLYAQLQSIAAVTPTSGGKVNVTLSAIKLS